MCVGRCILVSVGLCPSKDVIHKFVTHLAGGETVSATLAHTGLAQLIVSS